MEKLQSTIGDAIRTVIPQFGQRLPKQTAPFIVTLLAHYLIEHNGPVKKWVQVLATGDLGAVDITMTIVIKRLGGNGRELVEVTT
jgi:hypothetical protein